MCLLIDALRPDEEREILGRRGHLNCVNPVFADRYYRLDLSVWDEREMVKILVRLVRVFRLSSKSWCHFGLFQHSGCLGFRSRMRVIYVEAIRKCT